MNLATEVKKIERKYSQSAAAKAAISEVSAVFAAVINDYVTAVKTKSAAAGKL